LGAAEPPTPALVPCVDQIDNVAALSRTKREED
jgi:hypothetical protein